MIQYVIERSVADAGTFTDQQLREDSLKSIETLAHLGPRIQRLYSYDCEDKIYCELLASDESIIREHARLVGIPVDRVSAVRRLLTPVNGAGVVTPPPAALPLSDRSLRSSASG